MQVSAANRVGEAQPLEPCSLQQAVSALFTAFLKKKECDDMWCYFGQETAVNDKGVVLYWSPTWTLTACVRVGMV